MDDDVNAKDNSEENATNIKGATMKCCGKTCTAYVCKNCSNGDHKVECCQSEVNQRLSVADSKVLLLEKQQVELENKYLKELLDEMKDKNNILKVNNELLLQRINHLEGETKNVNKIKTVKQQEHKPTVQRGNKPTLQQEDKSTLQQENKPTEQQELKPSFSSKLRPLSLDNYCI
ncbi:hypothetical protein JTB14_035951 [Gonioctena quinquepunctata]|nr:hypothetical protein JTB14_035951 [Gonioctena quinquepunctata]